MPKLLGRAFFISATCLLLVSAAPKVHSQGSLKYKSVSFANLAPGEVENDAVKEYSVKISFSSESGIPYGGVYVRVFNASGISVFTYLCEKPLLFLNLQPGDYHVVAVDRKKVTRIKPFLVKKEAESKTVVKLKWPVTVVGY